MREANRPDRLERIKEHVDKGRTSDEARKVNTNETRWLLAVDVHYYLHRFWFSGAGVEAAKSVVDWVQRTVKRLGEKGLTDVVCCFDSKTNHRKELTKDWEDAYKPRPPKEPELGQQLNLVRELLAKEGFCCAALDGMEADDLMASYAKQFEGRVTIMSQDKDLRQCLSDKCNILRDIEWNEDETTGQAIPDYKWLSVKSHTEATGITPAQWVDLQMIQGDPVDGIKGAPGIGETGAKNLIVEFGSVAEATRAAKENNEKLLSMKRGKIMAKGLIELDEMSEVMRQLVELRTDLPVPQTTRV